jgi:hypothetical protein
MATADILTTEHISERHRVIRERRFSPKPGYEKIVDALQLARVTGVIHIDLREGGIGSIRFEESIILPVSKK